MAHVRQQIRSRLATATLLNLTTTGTSVHQSRPETGRPLETLPALLIYTKEEEVDQEAETFDGTTRKTLRILTLVVEGYAAANSNLDNTLDTISKEVEIAMAGDPQINSLAEWSWLTSTEMAFEAEAQTPHGQVKLSYEVHYRVDPNDPETALS